MITFDLAQELIPAKHRFSSARLKKIAHAFEKQLKTAPEGVVSLSAVTDEEIRRLNRMYRQKDKVTDVLSFASPQADMSGYLGDVVISFEQAVRQAEDGDLELELTDLLVHGILHVLGYDHEQAEDAEVMFPLQDAIVASSL
ncbi:MAG: rRNA maturation RNase YbeY [Patescibacteria group bacterium]|jgi:probable rRNA maturation factor